MPAPLISVIIPALDEAGALPAVFAALRSQEPPLEILVIDGGSRDDTCQVATAEPGVRVFASERGRATQMNAGARVAEGEILWFLHADCWPEPGAAAAIRRAMQDPRVSIGAFRFRLDGAHPLYRVYEFGVWLRTLLFRLPFGDQGLFLRRELFAEIGGYEAIPLFEDVRLVRAARRRGRMARVSMALPTSARRYEERGVVRTTLLNYKLMLMEKLGTSPEELARRRSAARRRRDA